MPSRPSPSSPDGWLGSQLIRAQRRAQRKLSSLKKRGAKNIQSPLFPMTRVKRMSEQGKIDYINRLDMWSKTRLSVIGGDVVLTSEIIKDRNQWKRNEKIKRQWRNSLDEIDISAPTVQQRFEAVARRIWIDDEHYVNAGRKGGSNTNIYQQPIWMEPKNKRSLRYRQSKAKNINVDDEIEKSREYLVRGLESADMHDAAEKVKFMSTLQLGLAVYRYHIFDDIREWWKSSDSIVEDDEAADVDMEARDEAEKNIMDYLRSLESI